ncbi:hypothetical protein ACEUCP_20450, partial [Aeromonas caviae]|uniref:hypothetical protein n=1 Tax=Aeromonas caviae TaxID=648 RepID=UPI0025B6445D
MLGRLVADRLGCEDEKGPPSWRNAVHLSGAALRFTGKRVFDIFTALGLDGLGRFSMNMTPMQP